MPRPTHDQDGSTSSPPQVLRAVGAPVSTTHLSPPQQGDALSGLALAVAGVGPAGVEHLPTGGSTPEVHAADAWTGTITSDTGWYVLLTQDCDVVRDAAHEPTILVAPLVGVDEATWRDLDRLGYSSRWYAYPDTKFAGLPPGTRLAVDLAWTTSVLKGALAAPGVTAVRPLSGPKRRHFSDWLAARTGRVPFPDDLVTAVLDPCHTVRKRLLGRFDANPGGASTEARVVGAVERWFAHHDGRLVTILGALTGPGLHAAGFIDPITGQMRTADLTTGQERLTAQVIKAMNKADTHAGYNLKILCADLTQVRADQFDTFALLMR